MLTSDKSDGFERCCVCCSFSILGMYTVCLSLADSLYLVSELMYWLTNEKDGAPTGGQRFSVF